MRLKGPCHQPSTSLLSILHLEGCSDSPRHYEPAQRRCLPCQVVPETISFTQVVVAIVRPVAGVGQLGHQKTIKASLLQ